MSALKTSSGSFTISLLLAAALLAGGAVMVSRLKDAAPESARAGVATTTAGLPREGLGGTVPGPPAAD